MAEKITGGFYHDMQKSSGLMSVTLHPNTETKDGINWKPVSGEKDKDGYAKEPIITSIIQNNFTIGISNAWSDNNGSDSLTSLFNELKPMAPYVSYISKNTNVMKEIGDRMRAEGSPAFLSKAVDLIQTGVDKVTPYLDKGAEYLNRALVIQGTRFSYYSGSGVSFGNLDMKVTIFTDWKNGQLVTVHDTLKKLYPYMIGKYVDFDEKDPENPINAFVGWQKPPGGFEADVKNVDNIQKGTLKLKFGSFYCIDNLVIKDVQATFSRQMVKDPREVGQVYPLFCEAQIIFQPATRYTDESLKNFVEGINMKDEQLEMKNELKNNLKEAKNISKKVR